MAHAAPVNCLAIGRHTGRFMATGGDDRKVMLWELGKANAVTVRLRAALRLKEEEEEEESVREHRRRV